MTEAVVSAKTVAVAAGNVAVISANSPPVNALSLAVRQGIDICIKAAEADASVTAIVLICEGKTFYAGADIKELGAPPVSPKISELCAIIEAVQKPVIAAMHGTVLGGGLEVAMSCHFRIAVPSTRCGLTEVKLGILPGASGTQRLPRIVGVPTALTLITSGDMINAEQALALGLYDTLADEGALLDSALTYANRILVEALPIKRVSEREDKLEEARAKPEIFAQFRAENAKKFRGQNAPEACIRCIEAAVNKPFVEGLLFEKQMIAELIAGGQPAALQYAFFADRAIKKIPNLSADTPLSTVHKVGVIGAGTMGGGIAMNFANVGLPVVLIETQQDALTRGLGVIRNNYERSAKRGRMSTDDVAARMALLSGSLDYAALSDCDLIIEAVFENMDVKKQVFANIDAVAKDTAILASNTSFLDIDEIGSVTRQPERVIGLHFFSPANVMKLLEVVRTPTTANSVLASVLAVATKIGKTPVVVGNCYGFVGNRIVVKRKEQGQALITEGAMPWQVDQVITDFGFPMGPFAMSDMAGLDIGWSKATSDPNAIRDVLCELDRRGQKTGGGYYDYDDNRKATPSPLVEQTIKQFMADRGLTPRTITDEEIRQRCIYPMINEACKILEEGYAIRASDIDVILMQGYGFPRYLGGLTFYADQVGLASVLRVMQQLQQQLGDTMKPAALLEKLVAEGGSLFKYSNV